MKKLNLVLILMLTSQLSFGQQKVSDSVLKELEAAEIKMFDAVLKYDPEFWKNSVHKDYITINADGVMQTKDVIMADSIRKDMFAGVTFRLFDRKIRVYGNIAIINGRSQYLMGDKVLAEVYHTEIWLKEKGKWMFDGWHGTYTKESQNQLEKAKRKEG